METARRRTRRCLVADGVSRSLSGIHLRISSATVNFSAAKTISKVNNWLSVGSGLQPPNRKLYHQTSAVGRHAAQASTANKGISAQCRPTSWYGSLLGVATVTISPLLFASAAAIAAEI